MGVFQQTGGTDGNRCLHRIEESKEILYQPVGQLGTKEGTKNHVVGRIAQGYLVQLVGVHELVEYIGTEDYGFRNHDGGILKLIELCMAFYHVVNESQTASLSSQRTITDTGKIGITVEAVALEHGYHSLILHLTVFHDGFENNLSVCIDVLKRFPRNLLQKFSYREDGTRIQPARNMVAADMIKERLGRNGKYHILQLLQVVDTGHFFHGMRVTENKVTKAKVV